MGCTSRTLVAYHVKQKIMKHLQKINEINSKISSLEYDRSQLNFINELQPKDEKNKLSDLIESSGCYFNDDEAVRIKICLQGIFLNRVQNTENELRKFKISGKYYIGSTVSFSKMKSRHLKLLRENKHHSYLLQKEWEEGLFEFIILEKVL